MNDLLLVGVNHKGAPVEVRERLAFTPDHSHDALPRLIQRLACDGAEAVILSTCNRTELYIYADDLDRAATIAQDLLADHSRLSRDELKTVLYFKRESDAAHHLLRVAAGLDSLVAGENEILGQVKTACELAHEAATTGPILSALFRSAIQAGKRVRTETDLGRTALSVATVVVDLAGELFGSLHQRTALLIGAGKMSSITARALVKAGLRCVLVANRTFDRAQKLAVELKGRAVHFDALADSLIDADIVICSTGAPHVVLHCEAVERAMQARSQQPMLIVDLAVPRDADPPIGALPNVRLTNIDDLESIVRVKHPLTLEVREQAEAIVAAELAEFDRWRASRSSAPTIQALQAKAHTISQREIDHTLRRLNDLTPEQQQAIQIMGEAIANKLLRDPILLLKQPPPTMTRAEWTSVIATVFGLN
ncbi:MAG: glutamyl-tRNA reductase [Chloroflexi bacterium]|nr:glutamyl-tRNA reductase [Chloroflexota bacterium]